MFALAEELFFSRLKDQKIVEKFWRHKFSIRPNIATSWYHDLHEVEEHQRVLCSKVQVREGWQFLSNSTGKNLVLALCCHQALGVSWQR